jgi:cytosine/adenosine deaminase-related metal-dependent hydrolase
MNVASWNLKAQFLAAVEAKGGFVNCHAHFDKAFYITREGLQESMVDMEKKWFMSDGIKRSSTQEQIATRIRTGLDILAAQGAALTASFIDAYEAVGHKAMDAALEVKKEYEKKITLLTIAHPLGGLVDPAARKLFEEVAAKADIVGGLPSKDRPKDEENMDIMFAIAKNLRKPVHVHIDQENNPNERDAEKLLRAVKKHGYEGRVAAVHIISVSAQPKEYRAKIYREMAALGVSAVVCPGAALGMRQLDQYQAPVHNSIANVPEMLEAGVTVGLGVDNVYDFYQPFIDGDMYTEVRMLQEACRYYHFDPMVDIVTANGRTILSMK